MTYVPAPTRYSRMSYARAGRSGLLLPRISLGLWNNFGSDRPLDVQRAIVRCAFDQGITHFDLANNYGPPEGGAEQTFGTIMAHDLRPFRNELVISTKAGYEMGAGPYQNNASRKHLLSSLDASLQRLSVDYVDVFYSHRFDSNTPLEETVGALVTAVTSGRALYAGISNYGLEETETAATMLRDAGVPLLLHQPSYSMFDRKNEDLFPAVSAAGAGAIVYSPLAQGLLTDRYLTGEIPPDSRAAAGRWLSPQRPGARYLERIRGLQAIAARREQTIAQLALAWVLRLPEVTSAIVGASSPAQLDGTAKALANLELTAAEVAEIEVFAVDGTSLQD